MLIFKSFFKNIFSHLKSKSSKKLLTKERFRYFRKSEIHLREFHVFKQRLKVWRFFGISLMAFFIGSIIHSFKMIITRIKFRVFPLIIFTRRWSLVWSTIINLPFLWVWKHWVSLTNFCKEFFSFFFVLRVFVLN